MKSKVKKVCLCLLTLILTFANVQPVTVKAILVPPSEYRYTPKVLTEEITERTTSIPVYVFDETTLYIKNGKEVIFKKFYQNCSFLKLTRDFLFSFQTLFYRFFNPFIQK